MQIHSASQGRSHSFLYRANQKGDWLHWFRINLKRMQSPHTGLCLKSSVKSLQMLPAQRKRGSAPAKGLELTRSISLLFLFFLSRWDFWLCFSPLSLRFQSVCQDTAHIGKVPLRKHHPESGLKFGLPQMVGHFRTWPGGREGGLQIARWQTVIRCSLYKRGL